MALGGSGWHWGGNGWHWDGTEVALGGTGVSAIPTGSAVLPSLWCSPTPPVPTSPRAAPERSEQWNFTAPSHDARSPMAWLIAPTNRKVRSQ